MRIRSWKRRMTISLLVVALLLTTVYINDSVVHANDNSKEAVLKNIIKNKNMKARLLWVDLNSNIERLDTPERVTDTLSKIAKANITGIVLDVKNTSGFVAYPSEYAPHLSTSADPRYKDYPKDYDLIENVVQEAKKHGIEVHININTFAAGSNEYKEGPAVDNPDWQTVVYNVSHSVTDEQGNHRLIDGINEIRYENYLVIYTPETYSVSPANRWGIEVQVEGGVVTNIVDQLIVGDQEVTVPENGYVLSATGTSRQWVLDNITVGEKIDLSTQYELVPTAEANAKEIFMNPIHPEVQAYSLDIIRELVTNYDIDGITLDRARYNNIYTDFSDLSREKFEAFIGHEVENWPEDVYTVDLEGIVPGPLYKKWFTFRAGNIHDFVEETKEIVRELDPDVLFNIYAGSWYPVYNNEGVNWGSKRYQPDLDWAGDDYHTTGYAEHLDFFMSGLYYRDVTIEESDENGLPYWYSVEGAADITMEALKYDTFAYGSIFFLQYKDRPEDLKRAIRLTEEKMHGIMLFDLVYIDMYDWWPLLEEVFDKKTKAPHSVPGLLKKVRE